METKFFWALEIVHDTLSLVSTVIEALDRVASVMEEMSARYAEQYVGTLGTFRRRLASAGDMVRVVRSFISDIHNRFSPKG